MGKLVRLMFCLRRYQNGDRESYGQRQQQNMLVDYAADELQSGGFS